MSLTLEELKQEIYRRWKSHASCRGENCDPNTKRYHDEREHCLRLLRLWIEKREKD